MLRSGLYFEVVLIRRLHYYTVIIRHEYWVASCSKVGSHIKVWVA